MKDGDFRWLFLALLVFLIGVPIARAISFSFLLGVGVLSLKGAGRTFGVAMIFAVAGIILNLAAIGSSAYWLDLTAFYSIIGFLLIAIFYSFKRVATDVDISTNRIVGAIAVYLLLGVLWAIGYTLVELSSPNSISGFENSNTGHWDSEWLYFSFVTLTTLGYGDIAPVSATARALAYMQAVFGQLYIAILVAGLVSAYISNLLHGADRGLLSMRHPDTRPERVFFLFRHIDTLGATIFGRLEIPPSRGLLRRIAFVSFWSVWRS
jgi:hypothetical protein